MPARDYRQSSEDEELSSCCGSHLISPLHLFVKATYITFPPSGSNCLGPVMEKQYPNEEGASLKSFEKRCLGI